MENLPESVLVARTNGEVYITEDEDRGTEYVRADIVLSVGSDLAEAQRVLDSANSQMSILAGKLRAILLGVGFTPEDANLWITNVDQESFKQFGGHLKFHSNAKIEIKGTKCNMTPRLILLN